MKKKLTITRVNPVAKAMLMLRKPIQTVKPKNCLLYTSDAADE